jgi:hypothetical protein
MTDRKVSGTIDSPEIASVATEMALKEIQEQSGASHNFQYEVMVVEKNGELIEIEVPIDDIDLIEDFDDDDLTDEGKRSLGMINSDHDTVSGVSSVNIQRDKLPFGNIEINQSEQGDIYIITCPHTGSTDVYQISTGIFASYETDQPFRVEVRLADSIQE